MQALQSLVRLFIQPLTEALQDKRPPLTAEQLQVLFSNAQLIHSLNSSFHASIVTRLSSWAGLSEAEHKVGDLIAQFAPYFKVYTAAHHTHLRLPVHLPHPPCSVVCAVCSCTRSTAARSTQATAYW